MPLTLELKYFMDHFNNKRMEKCNARSGVEVVRILEEASRKLTN